MRYDVDEELVETWSWVLYSILQMLICKCEDHGLVIQTIDMGRQVMYLQPHRKGNMTSLSLAFADVPMFWLSRMLIWLGQQR